MSRILNSKAKYLALTFFIPFFVFSLASRISLVFYSFFTGQLDCSFSILFKIFIFGFLNDIMTFMYVIAPLSIIVLIIPNSFRSNIIFKFITYILHLIWIFILSFSVAAEYTFWLEFGTRFNFIAVDYLVYTNEVIGNVIESYPSEIIILLIAFFSVAVFAFFYEFIQKSLSKKLIFKSRLKQAIATNLLMILVYNVYDSSITDIKKNKFASELAKNGIYNLFSAYLNNSLSYEDFYITLPMNEAMDNLKKIIKLPNQKYTNDNNVLSIERNVITNGKRKKYNVIILSVESLSSSFLSDKIDGKHITPELLKLIPKSLYFSNYYATGTRTVRGLEAMTLSIPPTAGSSVVRRPNNHNLYSIATILKPLSYDLKFIYAGFGYFDNMNDFFSGNHFKVVDRNSIPNKKIIFANIWGVADEVLYQQTIEEADNSYKDGKNFFSLVMTTSNHRPYSFPDNRIDLPQGSRQSAVKYSDFAIGDFLEKSKTKPWFKDTIFVITADHCASSAGKTNIPIDKYHIPLIIYAPEIIKTGEVKFLSSQIDLPPTILGLLNINYKSRFFGNDILSRNGDGHVVLGTYQDLGYFNGEKAAVLKPIYESEVFYVDKNKAMLHIEKDNALINNAISYYQTASYLFHNNLLKEE